MPSSIQDIIDAAVEEKPQEVASHFNDVLGQKVLDALDARKKQLAQSMFSNSNDDQETETEVEAQDQQEPEQEIEAQDAETEDTESTEEDDTTKEG
jgi:hypothetical protein